MLSDIITISISLNLKAPSTMILNCVTALITESSVSRKATNKASQRQGALLFQVDVLTQLM